MKISLVAACGRRGEIGLDNQLPWHLPADLKHFREVTTGKPVVMGRKTYESIGRPLPGRKNIILSASGRFRADGVTTVGSAEEALDEAEGAEELMVIGGSQIFQLFLPLASRIILTEVDEQFDADSFFPEIDKAVWEEKNRLSFDPDPKNKYRYSFVTLERREK